MSAPEPPDADFTVVDKRRQRSGSGEESTSGPEKAQPVREAPRAREAQPPTAGPPTPDLASLFLMLAHSALVHLGEEHDPSVPSQPRDLAEARYAIDLLALLQEKTSGNRTPEESQLLEALLYDLRLRYVDRLKAR